MNTQSMGLAVVTGASTGIGAVYADRLARRGYDLLLVARSTRRLDRLAEKLAGETGRKIEVMTADLTNRGDVAALAQFLRDDPRVTMLVNNAGVGATAPLLNSDAAEMSRMISLNVEAVTQLTYAAVPGFVKRGSGTIINIASIVAIAPERLNGVYGGTKAFVLAFSQSLRHELANTEVNVQVVLPGATATDFWADAGKPVEQLPQEIVMSAENADVTEGSGGIWERLHYDWSDAGHVVLTTTDSNLWDGASGHIYNFTRNADGTTNIDVDVVREGKSLKGKLLGLVLRTIGRSVLEKAFQNSVKAVEARYPVVNQASAPLAG